MTSTTSTLDVHPSTPPRGSDADQLTGGAMALVAALRVAGAMQIDNAIITGDGHGTVLLIVREVADAARLADALGLTAANQHGTEVDDLTLLHRFEGRFADWPFHVHCYVELGDALAAGGAA